MGSVTFWEGIDYTGNSKTIRIKDTTHSKILLYENAVEPIVIRSIKNYTNNKYIVALYYKYGSDAFGGPVLYIESDLSDINKANAYFFFLFYDVDPSFNGVILLRKTLNKNIIYNYVMINAPKAYDDINKILDLRNDLQTNTLDQTDTDPQPSDIVEETNPSNNIETTNVSEADQTQPTTLQTDLQYALVQQSAETDKYNACTNNRDNLIREVSIKNVLYDKCESTKSFKINRIKNNHAEQKSKLAKELQKLQQENNNLKTKGTTGNKNSMYSYFFVIVDLLMLFYILYKHNLFRMK